MANYFQRLETARVYMVGVDDPRVIGPSPVKIGFAKDVVARLAALQSGCPYKLTVLYSWAFPNLNAAQSHEVKCHVALRKYRIHGEWFDVDPEIARVELGKQYSAYIKRMKSLKNGEDVGISGISIVSSLPPTAAAYRRSVSRKLGVTPTRY